MFDWLGLAPGTTQLVGWILVALGVGLLAFLGLYLYNKHKAQTLPSVEKNEEPIVEENKKEKPKGTKADVKSEKPKTVKAKKTSAKKKKK